MPPIYTAYTYCVHLTCALKNLNPNLEMSFPNLVFRMAGLQKKRPRADVVARGPKF